jgi:methionyl-tRNA formyltransferase
MQNPKKPLLSNHLNTENSSLILLMHREEFDHFAPIILKINDSLHLKHCSSLNEIRHALLSPSSETKNTRLIAFCTHVIVPKDCLLSLKGNAYNLHPGPPEYPGIHPQAFALHHKKTSFGVTLHHMTLPTDSGHIIDSHSFPIPPNCTRKELGRISYIAAASLFTQYLKPFSHVHTPLAPNGQQWGSKHYTQKDLTALPPHLLGKPSQSQ